MSNRPKALGRNRPTGAVYTYPSRAAIAQVQPGYFTFAVASATFATLDNVSGSSPFEKRVVVRARQAYSHSASVGNRYFFPSFRLSQPVNATASFQLTLTTG